MQHVKISAVLVLAIWLVAANLASAQEQAYLRVETNYPEAILFADSLRLGSAFGQIVSVPSSLRMLRLVPPDVDTWSVAPVSRRVDLAPGDTASVRIDFPYTYRIESIPFGASVHIESAPGDLRRIGSTPTLYSSQEPIKGTLLLERPGFAVERIDPGSEVWNRYVVELSPTDELGPTASRVDWSPPTRHRAWIDYAALGVALAAGAAAIHYKFKADDIYAQYEDTADPSLRSDIKSLDLRSGVALGVMQAGIGVFAIRLALR